MNLFSLSISVSMNKELSSSVTKEIKIRRKKKFNNKDGVDMMQTTMIMDE